jgi:hypothetical protein
MSRHVEHTLTDTNPLGAEITARRQRGAAHYALYARQ